MHTYIVLLRGINVAGKRKLSMVDLRELVCNLGFMNVITYIQSGNLILQTKKSKTITNTIIKKGILNTFGYDVSVISRTVLELEQAVNNYPFSTENEKIVGFVFLEKKPETLELKINNLEQEVFKIDKDVVYLYCVNGFGKSKMTNNLFEKKLKVNATTRNLKTTVKLIELAKQYQ